jgi:protocatechuate 3,4-dioxygenase beta subunit
MRFAALIAALMILTVVGGIAEAATCVPTPPDALGPFYKPDAPERSKVGTGYVLSGVVRSAVECAPIERARIEFWLANTDGRYDDDHRATVFSDVRGAYRFESNPPPPYMGRPPHIHIRVSAPQFRTLVTQYYPTPGETTGGMELVLIPLQ